jgi:hypothetical protein
MGATYLCQSNARREKVRASGYNGIDYLEVLDQDAPSGSPPQQTLLVRCWQEVSAALAADDVTIAGGARVTNVGVAWARRLDLLVHDIGTPGDLLEPGEDATDWRNRAARLESEEAGESHRWLAVRTTSAGDFSTYTFTITVHGASTEASFDPKSATVSFSFKVDCPTDFDCPVPPPCPEVTPAAPAIDYLARDYASFRRVMLDRLAVLVPGYQPLGPADLGVTLVEILASAADQLAYYQDAVATEAYLGTARRRVSVRRHARLVDYRMHEGVNARAWIALDVATGADVIGSATAPALGAGTRVVTRTRDAGAVMSTEALERALREQDPTVFETLAPIESLRASRNAIRFHTWSESSCCLPKGATAATLVGSNAELDLHAGDVLVFEEIYGPASGLAADADPAHRHAVRLIADPLETKDVVEDVTVLEIAWAAADALPFSLSLVEVGAELASVARGNVVVADHGLSVAGETLPAPLAGARYQPALVEKDVTWCVAYDAEAARTTPAAATLVADVRAATPALVVVAGDEVWTPRADLFTSDAYATDLVLETENDRTARLRFGDGVHGRRPSAGVTMTASYRVGSGARGNVGADALVTLVSDDLGGIVTAVRNPLAAAGGVDPETLDEVKRYAPQAFRTQERAVTREDWAEIAARHAEVDKAVATFRWTGSYTTVFITVDRAGGLAVDDAFRAEVAAFLEPYRLAGYDIEVVAPQEVPLDIAMTVCVAGGYFASDVKRALADAFSNRALADGRKGFFHPDSWSFGDPVYLSRVIETALAVPGVHWVDLDDTPPKTNRFRRWGEPAAGEVAAGRIALGSLEIARLDNDPNTPENGRIAFTVTEGS